MTSEIVPAILVKTYQQFVRHLRLVEPYVKTVHLDVMDGKFVNNQTWADPVRVARLKHKLKIGVHLMVADPWNHIEAWGKAKVERFVVHWEAVGSDEELGKMSLAVRAAGMKFGVALNPETPVLVIASVQEHLDLVLIMGVRPGFGGQTFNPDVLFKVSDLKKKAPKLSVGVDGGVNLDNAFEILAAGADFLVAGTAIYKSSDIPDAISWFQRIDLGRLI